MVLDDMRTEIERLKAEIKQLRDGVEQIRPWVSRITDGILSDWQEDLCWDIDLICEESLKDGIK